MRYSVDNDTSDELVVRHRVNEEYDLFKYKMMSKSRSDIYYKCNQIGFYCCVNEYFTYAEEIDDKHIQCLLKFKNPIYALYEVYMEYDNLRFGKWDDVKEIIDWKIEKENSK